MTQPAFYLDASACSGCKACQAACKDKHDLPVGVLWRRVYEVTGGGWTRAGDTWTSDVFAYHLSLSCHHCEQPICAEVCPTQAMHKRADGIVVVDHDKCMGCQYCGWACPYDAPQYDRARGQMTKCDFCADNLAAGKPPACVAACPMRVLEMRVLEMREGEESSPNVSPLPVTSLTRPALIVKPHQAAQRPGALGNAEEVSAPAGAEHSLVAFTLLAQLAVGATWFHSGGATWFRAVGSTWFRALGTNGLRGVREPFNVSPLLVITVIMLAALMASFLHLGQPRHAWRALANLRTSWLSREVLFAALFAGALVGVLATGGRGIWIASVIGLALIISMAQVYRLRTVPEWNHRATTASFFVTTLLLGGVMHGASVAAGPEWAVWAIGLIALQALLGASEPRAGQVVRTAQRLRAAHLVRTVQLLRAAAIVALLTTRFTPAGWWATLALVSLTEVLGRQQFYAKRNPRSAWRFATPAP
ncbi:MAG: DMSO/selenate family reductase complex B subunit [Gemmatimonadaceae bacterium]|jgi:anaerobic dimethyl sulfoxide reductase subunit B (iron-sulfur subunit)